MSVTLKSGETLEFDGDLFRRSLSYDLTVCMPEENNGSGQQISVIFLTLVARVHNSLVFPHSINGFVSFKSRNMHLLAVNSI